MSTRGLDTILQKRLGASRYDDLVATAPTRLAYASAVVGTGAYVIGLVASYWLPEPGRKDLPD